MRPDNDSQCWSLVFVRPATDFSFESKAVESATLKYLISRTCNEVVQAPSKDREEVIVLVRWEPPTGDWVKLNFDGSVISVGWSWWAHQGFPRRMAGGFSFAFQRGLSQVLVFWESLLIIG